MSILSHNNNAAYACVMYVCLTIALYAGCMCYVLRSALCYSTLLLLGRYTNPHSFTHFGTRRSTSTQLNNISCAVVFVPVCPTQAPGSIARTPC